MLSPPVLSTPGVEAAISVCDAIVCSGGASASGTGTATPTVGGATGSAIATCGGGVFSVRGGGAWSSRYGTTMTLVSLGWRLSSSLVPNDRRNNSSHAAEATATERTMY